MTLNDKLTAIMERVTRKDVSLVFGKAVNESKRERQRYGGDTRTKPEIMADCLLAVYRAGVWDGLNAAQDEYLDDGK